MSAGDRARSVFADASSTRGTVVDNGAGVILALLVWGWIGLPLIQGGPAQVRDVIRAKFINKDASGAWLP